MSLDDDTLYTAASITAYAEENGLLMGEDKQLAKTRIRIALGRFSNNKDFPDEGDGIITLPGQSPTPAWFGWRWKDAVIN